MFFCYLDESGTAKEPTYVLAGLAIPINKWKFYEKKIAAIKRRYLLQDAEIHTAWILRDYKEQARIPDFEKLSYAARKYEVELIRNANLSSLRLTPSPKNLYKSTKKTFEKTALYIHLTKSERQSFILNIAKEIGNWGFCRLFAECIDKSYFNSVASKGINAYSSRTIDEQAFEQVITRFETYLNIYSKASLSKQSNSDTKADVINDKFVYYGLVLAP